MLDCIYQSIKGTDSKENYDDLLIIDAEDYCMFVVFDGVTNSRNGKNAVIKAKNYLRENHSTYLKNGVDMKKLMYQTHHYLIASSLSEPFTTYCTFIRDQNGYCYYSWLGDSRIYEITHESMNQLTHDDGHEEHIITKCLGLESVNVSDFRQVKISVKNCYLLLCTDGFYRILEKRRYEFLDCLKNQSLEETKRAISSFISGKNMDDATFILVQVPSSL